MDIYYKENSEKIATHHYRNAFRCVMRKSKEGDLKPRKTVGSENVVSRYLDQIHQQYPKLCKEFWGNSVSLECLYAPTGNLHKILFLLGHLERRTEEVLLQDLPILEESMSFYNLSDDLDRVVVSLV